MTQFLIKIILNMKNKNKSKNNEYEIIDIMQLFTSEIYIQKNYIFFKIAILL